MGDANPIHTLGDYSKSSHEGYRNTIELPVGNNVVPLQFDTIWLVQNGFSFYGLQSEDPNQHLKDFLKLVDSLDLDDENRERTCLRSITTWEDLTTRFLAQLFPPGRTAKLHNDIFWNDPRDFAKPVKAISLPQDFPSTSDRRVIELENQVQFLMEAHLAPMLPTQVNKITTSCEICSGPYDTQYCMENPERAFVEYASSYTDEAGGLVSNFMASQDARLSKFEADFKQQQSEMTNKINIVLKAITDRLAGSLPSDTVKNSKLSTSPVLSARSYPTEDPQCSTYIHGSINTITIHPKQQSDSHDNKPEENEEKEKISREDINTNPSTPPDPSIVKKNEDSRKEEPEAGGLEVEYFDVFPTQSELAYYKYLMCGPIPSIFLRNPIIMEGCPSNLKIPYRRRGVEYVMSKILGFYKECLELGPEYVTGMDDEGEVTKFLIKNEEEFVTNAGDGVRTNTRRVTSPGM
ncbi:hypothetical protein Tco_0791839 [Tanacetum coccineum]